MHATLTQCTNKSSTNEEKFYFGCTEVGRAPLIHFQKTFFQKGFLYIKISQIDLILFMDYYIG